MNVILEIEAIENPRGDHSIRIFPVKQSFRRPELKLDENNPKQHLELLARATACCILLCEKEGIFKTGEAIRKVIKTIEEEYVDASNELITNIDIN